MNLNNLFNLALNTQTIIVTIFTKILNVIHYSPMGQHRNMPNGKLSLVSVIYPITEKRNQAKNLALSYIAQMYVNIYLTFYPLAITNKLTLTGILNYRN